MNAPQAFLRAQPEALMTYTAHCAYQRRSGAIALSLVPPVPAIAEEHFSLTATAQEAL